MPRYLLIVSRRESRLLKYLRESFEHDIEVEIVVDRRQHQRRTAVASRGPRTTGERRQADRRRRPDIDERVATLGAAVVRLEQPRGVPPRRLF